VGKSNLKKKPKSKRTPYSKASDDEKVRRNWSKARGLYEREEWSVAVLRCGTCLELAVNFAIRQELVEERGLPLPFVDKLLFKANGISNKYLNIYLPIMEEWEVHDDLKKLWGSDISKVNKERNSVAHSGEFKSEKVATKIMAHTFTAICEIMDIYDHQSEFKPFET
jgi:hypothetical protein